MTTQSEVWSGGAQQKVSTIAWTQDNTSVNYQTNPRVTETNIYDSAGNRSRTTIDYGPPAYAQYGLPYFVSEYASDGVTETRRSYTDYNLSQAYLDRRIIGLVSARHLYDPVNGQWQAKTTFGYDDPARIQSQATTAPGHDQSYDVYFTARGNVTSVSRWDVNDIGNAAKALTGQMTYDAGGSVLAATDPANHTSYLGYSDSFSDGNNSRGTFAYPTTMTDADGFSSTVQYNYDFGAKTSAQGPPPAGQSQGAIQTFAYDSAARMQQVTTVNTGAYARYVYGPNYVQQFSSVNNVADDGYAIQVFDGAGRVIGAANNHPGSAGGYRMINTIYDLMGRAVKQSNPGEINNSWVPVGDDAAGLLYTQQTYDWKGRPLVTTNTDGTQKYETYSACGCAGSEVATLTDEVGRQQKVYSDVLGRTAKTEVLNWDGTVYATMVNTFNARNQATQVRQYQGSDQSGVYQDTTMSYDGYGRVQTKHFPEQNASTATNYAYNADDTIYTVTDARGASATYAYNDRHLVTGINYAAPSGVAATPNVAYGYDALGNRISMSDGFGSKSYAYNQLSQLTSETRTFNGVGTFTLSYDYNLAGELKKITDPTNMSINYGYDSVGRLTGVTGSDSLYANVSNYAFNFQYRAWGGVKAMTDGKGYVSSLGYNSKLQPTHFDISGSVVSQNYDYYNDGRISVVHNTTDQNFDRSYSYDHVGRLTEAKSGANVNGYQYGPIPYYETFGYDGFSNLTARESQSWNGQTDDFDSAAYTNYRRSSWGYDADGRNTTIDTRTNQFDAVGRHTLMTTQKVLWNGSHVTVNQASGYDGDGATIQDVTSGVATYYLRSSALGGAIIDEINSSGQKNIGYVYAGGTELAAQSDNSVSWKHNTAAGTGLYTTNSNNNTIGRTELDPLGADISLTAPPDPPPSEGEGDIGAGHIGGIMDARWTDFFNLSSGCSAAGVAASCSGSMAQTNMDAEMRAFFGYRSYDLPGNSNEMAQGEERYLSILGGATMGTGNDPEFGHPWSSVTIIFESGAVRTLQNPTLDQLSRAESGYGPDSGSSDENTHDISTPSIVNIFGGAGYFVSPQNTFVSEPQGWHAGVTWTKCPPVQFKISGIGPSQAPNTTAISQTARADIPNGGVAIKPKNFGVKGVNGNNRNVFLNMRFEVDWSTATPTGIPTGIPTEGPYFPVDNIGPASVRNSPGNQIDVYNYQKYDDALASTRTAMVTTWIPSNTAEVKCPE